jgi:uncharacterized membrane protein YfcA
VTPLHAAVILVAGFAAGGMNAVVGAGTLITFPALLAVGLPPVTANVSNTLGLVPGSLAGSYGYREQLGGIRHLLRQVAVPAVAGGLTGAALVLVLPSKAFSAVVPVLLLVAAALVAAQPWVTRRLAARRSEDRAAGPGVGQDVRAAQDAPAQDARRAQDARGAHAGPGLLVLVYLVAIYGGYFGAAQGVLLLALFGAILGGIQAANGVKNVIAAYVNVAAAILFAFVAHVDWAAVGLLAVSSALGGTVGGRYGRSLPDGLLRTFVVLLAVGVALKQILT